jgi:dethiobiotin synthetase
VLVTVIGTDTEVGKTWVAAALARHLVGRGRRVSVRKPVQSFAPGSDPTDAELLASATGEPPAVVCSPHRWYARPMAPPMAAEALGAPVPTLAALVDELLEKWPPADVDVGLVEGAGGVASPLARDGHNADLARALGADLAVLVAPAGLGTISAVRLGAYALAPVPVLVFLNRFDPKDDLHARNREWLVSVDGLRVATSIDELEAVILDAHQISGLT